MFLAISQVLEGRQGGREAGRQEGRKEGRREGRLRVRETLQLYSKFAFLSIEIGKNLCASSHTMIVPVIRNQEQHLFLHLKWEQGLFLAVTHMEAAGEDLTEILEKSFVPFLLARGISAFYKHCCLI